MAKKILIVTGDAGESYETWFAVHRFQEAGYETRVAAPSKKRLHLVMHDFEPGWDTYREAPGYGMESDLTFGEVVVDEYEAIVLIGGRAPEYLRNDGRLIALIREFDRQGKWLFSICHGVQLLAAAGLLRIEVEAVGARWIEADVVRAGRIVSAPTWQAHPAFYREIFACLQATVPA
jgi:deglycase